MKNKIIKVTVIFLLISVNVSAQLDYYQNTLNGSVKQVIKTEPSYNGMITTIKDYNLDGFLKVESIYGGNTFNKDSLNSRNKFTYKLDNKKRVSEILIIDEEKLKRKKIIEHKSSFYTINTLWKGKLKWKIL